MSTPSPKGRGGMGRGLGALGLGGPVSANTPTIAVSAPNGDTENASPVADKATPNGGTLQAPANVRKTGLLMVPITSIAPNPYQPRKHIDGTILAELAQSIRENGLIQPPVVSANPDYDPNYQDTDEEETSAVKKEYRAKYLLIAGERRWQASKLAGFVEIPVVLKEATPLQMLELALVENIQRADLNPLEEAEAYQQLMREFKFTQEAVAQRVGKSRVAIANSLRLFDLPPDILKAVYDNYITEGHARALLTARSDRDKRQLLKDIIAKGYSVRTAEEMARRMNAETVAETFLPDRTPIKVTPAERETRDLEERFRDALQSQVKLSRNQKDAGKLVIQFNSAEELNAIFDKIVGLDVEI